MKKSLLLSALLLLAAAFPALAASQNWDGGSGVNGNWSDLLNWNGAVPGSTSVTTNTDVATFNAAIVNTWGDSALNPVVIDSATQNIGGLSFTLASGNYFLGSTGGNALRLTGDTVANVGGASRSITLSGLTATNALININAPISLYAPANGAYAFINNSANGAGAGAGTLNFGGTISSGATGVTLYLQGSNTNANTISGNILGTGTPQVGINKSGAGTWVLSGANNYGGDSIFRAGTTIIQGTNATASRFTVGDGATPGTAILQFSGANGAMNTVSSTATELRNTGSLVLDNRTVAGGNNNNRIENTQAILLNGGSFIIRGADAAATNTTETVGALTIGSGSVASAFLNHNSLLTVEFGGTNTATLTVASLTRAGSMPTMLVNGTNLGMDSASTASVGRLIVTGGQSMVGTTAALATGINSAVKNTQVTLNGLVGEATATTGGLGTVTGTANTFLTYNATTGLRPLNPTDEFTNNAITAGNNTYITSATTAAATAAINSLVINGADLSIDNGQTLTDTSGLILFASSNAIKPTATTGTLAFGGAEAKITINNGVTAQINAPITGTGGVLLSGPGTMQVNGTAAYSSLAGNAGLNLASGSALTVGSNNATTVFTGALSGSGSLTKTGGGTMSIGVNSIGGNGINDDFLYSGDINVSGGTLLTQWSSEIYTKSKLTVSTGATLQLNAANTAVASLFGTAGTITAQPAGGGASLFIAYTGTDPNAGFTGTLTAFNGYQNNMVNTGSGDLTFGTAANGARVSSAGTGKVTAVAITGNSTGAAVSTPFSRVVLTGNSGVVNGANGVTQLSGGTLTLAPSGSGSSVLVTGQGMTGTFRVRFASGATLQLDKGSNTSMEYRVGLSTNTNTDFLQFVSSNAGPGSLILDPVGGAATLGTTAKFTILNSTTGKILSNGLVPSAMFVVDNDGTKKGDFVTYNGTGVAGDAGYQQASYTHTDTFVGSTNTSVVKNAVAQIISAPTSAFALRNDSTISINSGQTLTLGAPTSTANANANATQSPNTGLILNGGTISGAGTLAFGATAASVYTSSAGGTISAAMTGSGGTNAGYSAYSGNTPVSLLKSGAGTLTLSGANTFTGAIVINGGAVDVGTITTGDALSGSTANLTLGGGVIQGNGTFDRSLGGGLNQVTWNGINHTNSNVSGGFAARGADLIVAMGGTGSPTAVVWGIAASNQGNVSGYTAPEFISEVGNVGNPSGQTGILMFGSNTSDSQVDFRNAINLGNVVSDVTIGGYGSPLYYRIINVAQGTGTDSAKISGVISSTVEHGVIKDGAGKLILSANNTYTGDTVVAHGTLLVNNVAGSGTGTGALAVNSGAILGGSGTIAGATTISGSLRPGNSIGTLTIANDVLWNAGDNWVFELGSAASTMALAASGGSTQDQLNITGGTSDFLKGTGSTWTFDFSGVSALGWYKVVDWAGTTDFTAGLNSQFLAANLGGGNTGTFTVDSATSALYLNVVPEPSTWLLLAFGLTVVVTLRRRRSA